MSSKWIKIVATALLGLALAVWAPGAAQGAPPANPAVSVKNCDGRWEQFGVGGDHHLWHRWQTTAGGSWSAWNSFGGYLITTRIMVANNVNCHLEAFGLGGDYAMWHIWQTTAGGTWSNWSSLGGSIISGPQQSGFVNGKLWLSATWSNGRLVCDQQTRPASGPWTGWYYCSPV